MKILVLTKTYVPKSGWGRYTFETVSRIAQSNEVLVLSEEVDKSIETNFKVEKLNFINVIKNIFNFKLDIIHAYDGDPYAFYAFLISLFGLRKYIVNGVGTYTIAPIDLENKSGLNKIKAKTLRFIYKRTSGMPAISKFVKDELDKKIGGLKTSVVHLGLTKMGEEARESDILERYKIKDAAFPVVMTVGEIKSRKGQFYTSEAVKMLKNKYPNIKYLVVGKNGSDKYLEKIEGTIISDAKSDADLKTLYKRADVFALNSINDEHHHFEGFGLVVLEANQFGVPAVGSRDCGIEDAIKDGENGYLAKQGDTADIAEKIEMILDKKKENKDYWINRSKAWANNFSWDKTAEAYIKEYKKALKKS